MGVNRTEHTLSSRKATNSRVAPLRGATLGGWLLLKINLIADHNTVAFVICSVVMGSLINQLFFFAHADQCLWCFCGPRI